MNIEQDSLYWSGFRECNNNEWFLASEKSKFEQQKPLKKVSKVKETWRFMLAAIGVSAVLSIGVYAITLLVELLATHLDRVFDAIIAAL